MVDRRSLQGRAGLVVAIAAAALVTATGAWALGAAGAGTLVKGNVTAVKEGFWVTNGAHREGTARCPAGTRVFSGGFAVSGQHAKVFVAGPSRSQNGYVVDAFVPPVNIIAGIGKETAQIAIVAYCAPVGQPIVLG